MDKEKLVLSIVKEYLYRGLTEEELKALREAAGMGEA